MCNIYDLPVFVAGSSHESIGFVQHVVSYLPLSHSRRLPRPMFRHIRLDVHGPNYENAKFKLEVVYRKETQIRTIEFWVIFW